MATEITYNGSVIAVLTEEQTATLHCGSKTAATDICAAFDTTGHITYNGCTVIVYAGQTATLVCAGKRMKTDVVVSTKPMENGVRLLTSDGYLLADKTGLLVTASKGDAVYLSTAADLIKALQTTDADHLTLNNAIIESNAAAPICNSGTITGTATINGVATTY